MNQYPGVPIVQDKTAVSQISGYPDTQCIVVYNESPFFLQVNLVGSGVYGLAAYTADCFQVYSGFTGNISFMPTQYIAITTGSPPASIAFVQAYGRNEPLTRLIQANQATGYPISLNRLQNIGNGSSFVGTATNIVNDTNVAGTSIVESTVSGDISSSVSLTNDAQMVLGDAAHAAKLQVNSTVAISTPNTLAWDNAGTSYGTIHGDTSGGVFINASNTGQIQFLAPGNALIAHVDSTGLHLDAQTINLLTGNIAREAHGASTTVAAPSTKVIAHGLGAFPYWADIVINSTSSTTTYSVSWDATNITVLSSVGGLAFTWIAIA